MPCVPTERTSLNTRDAIRTSRRSTPMLSAWTKDDMILWSCSLMLSHPMRSPNSSSSRVAPSGGPLPCSGSKSWGRSSVSSLRGRDGWLIEVVLLLGGRESRTKIAWLYSTYKYLYLAPRCLAVYCLVFFSLAPSLLTDYRILLSDLARHASNIFKISATYLNESRGEAHRARLELTRRFVL